MMRLFLSLLLSGLFILALPACATPLMYSAEPIEAWVIDAETKQPLEGVIVIAHWELVRSPGDRKGLGYLELMETVTDATGRFSFPSWGPRSPKEGYLHDYAPLFFLFKPGYQYGGPSNFGHVQPHSEPVRRSGWTGKKIPLRKFGGTLQQYAMTMSAFDNGLSFIYHNEHCQMVHVPRLVVALHQEEKRLREAKAYSRLTRLEPYLNPDYKDLCGLRDVLRKHLP